MNSKGNLIHSLVNDKKYIAILAVYTFLLLLICSRLSPLFFTNEWPDVNIYFNIGKCIFEGRTLYTEAFDHKGPLIFFIYGIGYLISNDTFLGVFIIQVIAWILMTYTVFLTARLYLSDKPAFLTALLMPFFLLRHMREGGSAEEFILILLCVSLFLFLKHFRSGNTSYHRPLYMFIHGMVFASVLMIKFNLGVFWGFLFLGLFLDIISKKNWRCFINNTLSLLGGILLVALPIVIYLYANNALVEAYNIYIVLNSQYAKMDDISFTGILFRSFWRIPTYYLRYDTLVFVVAFVGLFVFPFRCLKSKIAKYTFFLSMLSLFIVINIPKRMYDYYLIPVLLFCIPGMIVLVEYALGLLNVKVLNGRRFLLFALISVFILALGTRGFSLTQFDTMLREKTEGRRLVPNPVIDNFSKIISQEDNPTLLDLNLDELYSLFTICNIKPNVRYFITPNLKDEIYPQMRKEQTKYIENKEVMFVTFSEGITIRSEILESIPALKENYNLICSDTLDYQPEYSSMDPGIYYLFKRKD